MTLSAESSTLVNWSAAERRAWAWPDRVLPSEWAARNRVLSSRSSNEPGRWHNERTPYLTGVMDAICEPGVEELTILKPVQWGGTECWLNILGYWIDEDPGPCLIVMPSEAAVRELVEDRIRPLIENSPALKRHLTGDPRDFTYAAIRLRTMTIYFGWAGSPQSLATRPCRYGIFDECDKYPPFSGREADPISLGTERTATFGRRRRILKTSTTTTRHGAIYRAFDSSAIKREFHVPCPNCGKFWPFTFDQIKWPRDPGRSSTGLADQIEREHKAYYECPECQERIVDARKTAMLLKGKWVGEGAGKSIAFHGNAMMSPWRTFSECAAQFLRADGDVGRLMNFRNSWLAEPFEDIVARPTPSLVREKSLTAPERGVVPIWAQALLASADTQKDWFKVHIRAWGWGYKSQLVFEGICRSFDELYRIALEAEFAVESGGKARPTHLLIDSGGSKGETGTSRTNEVYQFALRDPGRILPTKGASRDLRRPWTMSRLPNGVTLYLIDTSYYKDMLTRLVNDPDVTKWLPYRDVSDQYCLEMASEHKVVKRGTSGNQLVWVPVSSGVRQEAWDCEVLQCAAADMANIGAAPLEPQTAEQSQPTETRSATDWLNSHRGKW